MGGTPDTRDTRLLALAILPETRVLWGWVALRIPETPGFCPSQSYQRQEYCEDGWHCGYQGYPDTGTANPTRDKSIVGMGGTLDNSDTRILALAILTKT